MTITSALAELAQRFAAQLPDRIHDIRLKFDALISAAWQTEQAIELHRLVHSLTGAAGTFGMGSLSDAARHLEGQLNLLLKQDGVPGQEQWSALQAALAQIEQLVLIPRNSDAPSLALLQPSSPHQPHPLIYLVEDDAEQAHHLHQMLLAEDFRVRAFTSLESFRAAWNCGETPDAVVMDMVFPEGGQAGAQIIASLRANYTVRFPVVFVSMRDDIEAHLAAYRSGAARYLTKPVDIAKLAKLLHELVGRVSAQPYRVVLVDDDPLLLELNAAILQQAGMVVCALSESMETLNAVREFKPDVVLLDVYMPGASGPELAAVLREQDAYAQLPILFLSAETDISKQLLALELGGDDFLVKPIDPEHLVAAVKARAHRSRQIYELNRNLERVLYEREREHLALEQHALVSVSDVAGRIIYVNDKFCKVSGYAPDELIGQDHRLVKSGEHAPEFYGGLWRTIAAGDLWHGLICNRRKNGTLYWVESSITPFLDAQGKPYQYVAISTDTTALKQSEERWGFALEGAGDGVWDWNVPTGEVILSKAGKAMFGYGEDEVGNTVTEWQAHLYPIDQSRWQEALSSFFRSKADKLSVEYRVRCKDGSYKWILTRGMVVNRAADGRVTRMIGVHTDINQRKIAEERLVLFGHIFDASERAIVIADDNGRVLYNNPAFERIYGYAQEEVAGKDLAIFFTEESRQSVALFMAALGKGGSWSGLLPQRRKDGSEFVSASSIGGVLDEQGKPRYVFNIASDYTSELERQEELRIARDKAESANRAKSDFLSSMSHELRTPLNAILGFGQLLEADERLERDQQEGAREIIKAGKHLLGLVNEILDLAKIESGKVTLSLESVRVGDLVNDCRNLVQPLLGSRAISLQSDDWGDVHVCADRVKLMQALLNLLSNAIKYNREQGSVRVSRQCIHPGCLRIAVTDSGPGIAAERIGELFQPFSRLDAESSAVEGTGIGLTITRKLVEMMGGSVGVESTPGAGSTFWIELPEGDAPAHAGLPSQHAAAGLDARQMHCVLYVDDNLTNLELVSQMMRKQANIQLITVSTAEQGLEFAMTHQPQLILLDINMPGLDGYDILKILKADTALHEIPVIAVTAQAMPHDIERVMQAGFADCLTKPLDRVHLLNIIDETLNLARSDTSHD